MSSRPMRAPATRRRRPGRPPGPSRAKQARARLVATASEIYAEGGDAGLSYAVLAERSGLTKPTLFHYFPTKETLLYAVFQALGERLEAAAEGWFDAPPASFAARLERLVGALVDFYGADPINARILCRGLLETGRAGATTGADAPPVFGHFVRPNPCKGRSLHNPYFDPFWAACAEAGVPVGLHPSGAGDLPGTMQGLPIDAPIMGHPSIFFIDDYIGFSQLVCGGVLERHPELTVVVLEAGGGWLGHWFDRFDHFAQVYAWMAPELRLRPSEYFKRQCFISFDPDESTLPLLAPVIGEERIVWASDYPHLDATFPGVVRELEEHLERLPPAARAKVRGANAARLYGLAA
ncbi:MAG: amidohydrolase family protein [Thermodesulfobacteriota bacterium]